MISTIYDMLNDELVKLANDNSLTSARLYSYYEKLQRLEPQTNEDKAMLISLSLCTLDIAKQKSFI